MSSYIYNIFLIDKIAYDIIFRMHMNGIISLFNVCLLFLKYMIHISLSGFPKNLSKYFRNGAAVWIEALG